MTLSFSIILTFLNEVLQHHEDLLDIITNDFSQKHQSNDSDHNSHWFSMHLNSLVN